MSHLEISCCLRSWRFTGCCLVRSRCPRLTMRRRKPCLEMGPAPRENLEQGYSADHASRCNLVFLICRRQPKIDCDIGERDNDALNPNVLIRELSHSFS